jgi:predicted aspartyl protease
MSLTRTKVGIPAVFTILLASAWPLLAATESWQREDVNWKAGGGRQIKGIRYPQGKPVPTRAKPQAAPKPSVKEGFRVAAGEDEMLVESPPVDGFVPWIAVSITKQRKEELEMEAEVETSIRGTYPSGVKPQTDYIIGLFDTGASAHVVGYADAVKAGLYKGLTTSNETTVTGVTGSVDALVSLPLAVFIDGLDAIAPQTLTLDQSGMMGQSNVAVIVGENPGNGPDLPTAIGSPLGVYYTTLIRNDHVLTIERNGETFSGPDIRLYEADNPETPSFTNVIPLELRPLGGVSVQYMPSLDLGGFGGWDDWDLDDILNGGDFSSDMPPASPSVIMGMSSQSLFFVHSVDLYEGQKSVLDKNRFMLDTGAQITVIGSRIAARLQLDPAAPEFEVEIEGVTGDVVMAPGYYVDALEIPALGQWFRARNIPVVFLDMPSPEGGSLDGIIGMNLFVEFNLIVRGGGLFLADDPTLELQRIVPPAP